MGPNTNGRSNMQTQGVLDDASSVDALHPNQTGPIAGSVSNGTPGAMPPYQWPPYQGYSNYPVAPPPGYYVNRQYPTRNRSRLVPVLVFLAGLVLLVLLLTFGILWATTGVFTIGPANLTTDTQAIPVGQAQNADIDVGMGVGNLTLSGGAGDMVNATFIYDPPSWKPNVNYSNSGTTGRVSITQPSNPVPIFSRHNDWNVKLSNNLPINLTIQTGVGNSNLKLQDVDLTNLTVSSGVGNTSIDLSGNLKQNLTVTVSSGTGSTTLIVPKAVGVQIHANSGLGNVNAQDFQVNGDMYTNAAYGKSAITIRVELKSGVGDVKLIQS